MVFVFRIASPALPCGTPASDLDGHEWTFQDASLAQATARAHRRLDSTFAYSTAARVAATSLSFVGQYPSLAAYRRAEESAVRLTSSDVDAVLDVCLGSELARVGS